MIPNDNRAKSIIQRKRIEIAQSNTNLYNFANRDTTSLLQDQIQDKVGVRQINEGNK